LGLGKQASLNLPSQNYWTTFLDHDVQSVTPVGDLQAPDDAKYEDAKKKVRIVLHPEGVKLQWMSYSRNIRRESMGFHSHHNGVLSISSFHGRFISFV